MYICVTYCISKFINKFINKYLLIFFLFVNSSMSANVTGTAFFGMADESRDDIYDFYIKELARVNSRKTIHLPTFSNIVIKKLPICEK